ncbi:hypothetical protein, partial [Klebsiella pneumoniae]|uniref:hypothetical protein n=1 Tax=Klebsiella pneumoniae TaxID=573 RepID=UPI001F4AD249
SFFFFLSWPSFSLCFSFLPVFFFFPPARPSPLSPRVRGPAAPDVYTSQGSGRGSVRAKHGPQPAWMRAAPAFRERLSDFEAVSTGSFSNNGE